MRFFKSLKKIQGKRRFVGTVFIKLYRLTNTAVIDFIDCLLEKEYISVEGDCTSNDDVVIIARNNYMPLQEDTDELLDQCVLLNTYFSNYFKPIGCVESFDIYFRLDDFDNNFSMYQELDDIQCPNKAPTSSLFYQMKMGYQAYLLVIWFLRIQKQGKRCQNRKIPNTPDILLFLQNYQKI